MPEIYSEDWLIELSRMERELWALPDDTGERYDENGEIVRCEFTK